MVQHIDNKKSAPRYVLTLRARPGIDAVRALLWVLKRLLRQYGFRCVGLREELTTPLTEERNANDRQ
jgi:hypothetical protein